MFCSASAIALSSLASVSPCSRAYWSARLRCLNPALSIFLLRLCEKPSHAKAQMLRSIAETMIKALLINWFQAVELKIRPIAFLLPPISPKKSRNMSHFFW